MGTKISALTTITGANTATGDLLVITDVSDTTQGAGGTTKSITRDEMKTALLAAPGAIGATTPAAGSFTTLSASGTATFAGLVSTTANDFSRTHATTTAQLAINDLRAISTGDMADGFGAQQRFLIRDTAAVDNHIANISGIRDGADNKGAIVVNVGTNAVTEAARFTATGLAVTGAITASTTIKAGGYTVATLPAAGTVGRIAYVTDATTPTYAATLTGSGAVKVPVFDNGTAWVSA